MVPRPSLHSGNMDIWIVRGGLNLSVSSPRITDKWNILASILNTTKSKQCES